MYGGGDTQGEGQCIGGGSDMLGVHEGGGSYGRHMAVGEGKLTIRGLIVHPASPHISLSLHVIPCPSFYILYLII